jgi:hypothetical protein
MAFSQTRAEFGGLHWLLNEKRATKVGLVTQDEKRIFLFEV